MIVWLVSYPRSGNTLTRLVLKQCFRYDTYSIYNDPLFKKRGIDSLLGQRDISEEGLWRMASGDQLYFVKTHRKHEDVPGRVVYIVRDGRDTYVSYAKYRVSYEGIENYADELHQLVRSEAWAIHERIWRTNGIDAYIHYESLLSNPLAVMRDVLERFTGEVVSEGLDRLATFDDLHRRWPNFFRRGKVGTYKDEMPKDIQKLFWNSKIHKEVMERHGFS